MKPAIFIFGPQGSGKGTQAELLGEAFGFAVLEAGELIRGFANGRSEDAKLVKAQIEQGQLIDRTVLLKIFDRALKAERRAKGLILDGFGRRQSEITQEIPLLTQAGYRPLGLVIRLSDTEAIERLTKRYVCTVCGWVVPPGANPEQFCARCGGRPVRRKDDTRTAIKERLQEYHQETEPVIKAFLKYGPLVTVDGRGTVRAVRDRIEKSITSLLDEEKK